MAIMTCGRCGAQTAKLETCNYCRKKVCNNCIKSSRRVKGKVKKLFICKGCWGSIKSRRKFKSAGSQPSFGGGYGGYRRRD